MALIHELGSACEVRCDNLARQLYATDASIYQIVPMAVAFPKSAAETAEVTRLAGDAGIPVTYRGAGTGLAGGALGEGLIVDLARYNRRISDFDRECQTVRVGAGVVLDDLNDYLKPYGLWFGPDVATSSRACIGGMIANNSSGARAPLYGTTSDHVSALEVVLADGTILAVDAESPARSASEGEKLRLLTAAVDAIVARYEPQIREHLPPGLVKRWPGYALDRYLRHPGDLTHLIGASEGTLAGILSAELRLVPLPKERGLAVVFFASVADAMQATVELLDLRPAAIEHVDRLLFDQTRGQMAFAAARSLLELDTRPCEAFLIVEFFEDGEQAESCTAASLGGKLAALTSRNLGLRTFICRTPAEQALVWGLRKQGLTLLTSRKGAAKPISGVEDVAVRPEHLPAYVADLRGILEPLGVGASFYGHAASGLLHVRPVLDLHTAEGVASYREIADQVFALARQYRGTTCGEHGVGIARTEYMPQDLGPELMQAHRELKAVFDPRNVLNPGKIIPDGRYRIETNLRQGAGHTISLPFAPRLGFVERDESFVGNLEQCNGNGMCLKSVPTMCPTYIATHEEIMSTRGRANTIRAVLEGQGEAAACATAVSAVRPRSLLTEQWHISAELEAALGPCLSCKACKSECPSNVDMALLKAELLHARQQKRGVALVDRVIAAADRLGRLGCAVAPLANAMLAARPVRWLMEKLLGIAASRQLPKYASQRFDRWFAEHERNGGWHGLAQDRGSGPETGRVGSPEARAGLPPASPEPARPCHPAHSDAQTRHSASSEAKPQHPALSNQHSALPKVVLWDDTWVRYHEPNIGIAAVRVLEAVGYQVVLAEGRECCGRPAFSRGRIDEAARMGRHNLELLERNYADLPIVFLEPSCHAMFIDEYRQLKLPGAEAVARRAFQFEHFIWDVLQRKPDAFSSQHSVLGTQHPAKNVAIHAHCHAKALTDVTILKTLAEKVPGVSATLLNTGCCGMAGAYGMLRKNYELSLQVAEPLIAKIKAFPPGSVVIADGTSCRHQISDLAGVKPLHMTELLAAALLPSGKG